MPVVAKQNVFGLQVAVENSQVVQVIDARDRFCQIEGCVPLHKDSLTTQSEEEFTSCQKIHDDEQFFACLKRTMHLNDKRVVDPLQNVSLGLDVFDVTRFLSQLSLGNNFHGQNLSGLFVSNLQNFSECPHPDYLEKLKVFRGDEMLAGIVGFCSRVRRITSVGLLLGPRSIRMNCLGKRAILIIGSRHALQTTRRRQNCSCRRHSNDRCSCSCLCLLHGFSDESCRLIEVFKVGILAFVVSEAKVGQRGIHHIGGVDEVARIQGLRQRLHHVRHDIPGRYLCL
mmetsp:Transcript_23735/g.65851  ORF Transcript_23735/g.65851 Transcript_23735/m.65851 type:complete len:284 (+) Transcript_23735:1725-2576(+)